jgi:autotransporter-associated beta strand protein
MRAVAPRGAPRQWGAPDASISDIAIAVASARARRRVLLAGAMLAGVVLLTALADPAFADGGKGGGLQGGAGGAGFTGNPGADGVGVVTPGGGGGGGGGAGGAAGGAGGTSASPDGQNGTIGGVGQGSGGGGGGFNGNGSGAATITNTTPLAGGAGGNGAAGNSGAGGGGGGGGGYGAIVTGTGASSNSSAITGGNGGGGGLGSGSTAGSGGDGGAGVQFTTSGATFTNTNPGSVTGGTGGQAGLGGVAGALGGVGGAGIVGSGLTITNTGTITGGNGGAAAAFNSTAGAGGAGIIGSDLIITSSGAITGGLGGDGVTRANALTFSGGANSLDNSGGTLTGNIAIASGASLNFTQGSAVTLGNVITGAGSVTQSGSGTLTLTGANTYTGGTAITGGTLSVSADNNLGANTGALGFGGGTLQLGASFNLSSTRTITLNAGGGTIDTNGFSTTISQAIGGVGALTKTGTGTLTLTGANGYSGGTNLNGGTVNVSADNNLGASNGALSFGGGTLQLGASFNLSSTRAITLNALGGTIDTNGFSTTISQAIGGGGALTKTGTGTLTLTATNTYSGGTTITAGTLQANQSFALGSGSVAFTGTSGVLSLSNADLANAVVLGTNVTGTIDVPVGAAAALTGTATLGAGATLVLNPSNGGFNNFLFLGNTTATVDPSALVDIRGGVSLSTAGGAALLAANVNIGAGGRLELGSQNPTLQNLTGSGIVSSSTASSIISVGAGNFSGVMTDSGSGVLALKKIGTGTLTLSGTNTYSGGTTVNAGLINFNSASNFGSGLITVNGGGLQWATGTTTDISSKLAAFGSNGATFDTNGNTVTLAFTLSGTGGVTKAGTGTLTLSGTDTYSGATTVNAGTLIVNGSIANSAVTVNSGAMLAGAGTVGATTIMSGGIFAPGNSPGTMTVAGNLAFQSGALYLVQVNPSTASSANVTAGGSASLAGTVLAVFASGSYVARNYTIASAAGGRSGTFGSLTTSNLPAGFTAALSYTATDAILNLTANLGGGPSALGTGGLSGNQLNVANALNAFFNNGGALPPAFVNIFGLTGANLANALTLLSGEAATGGQQAAFQFTNQFLNVMLDPFVDGRGDPISGGAIGFAPEREELPDDIALAYSKVLKAPPKPPQTFEQRWSVWGAGYGGSNRTTGDTVFVGSHDLSARTAGGAAGLDYRLAPGTVVGFALAGGGTNWSLAQGIGGGKSDAFQAGVYGTTRWGSAYLAAALAFTNHWMSTDRSAFAGDHLTASFNAQSFGGRVESGYRFATYYGGLTPYAAIQSQTFHTPGYTESDLNGGGFGLGFNSRNATDTRSELGGRFDRLLLLSPEAALTLRARVAWAHDWISDPTLGAVFQTLPGASFIVNGATPAKNSALTSAGAELRLANGVVLLGKFDSEFASHSSTYAGTGTVRYTW